MSANPNEFKDVSAIAILRAARRRLRALAGKAFTAEGVGREELSDELDVLEEMLAALARALAK